jgi:hypothetical protein
MSRAYRSIEYRPGVDHREYIALPHSDAAPVPRLNTARTGLNTARTGLNTTRTGLNTTRTGLLMLTRERDRGLVADGRTAEYAGAGAESARVAELSTWRIHVRSD